MEPNSDKPDESGPKGPAPQPSIPVQTKPDAEPKVPRSGSRARKGAPPAAGQWRPVGGDSKNLSNASKRPAKKPAGSRGPAKTSSAPPSKKAEPAPKEAAKGRVRGEKNSAKNENKFKCFTCGEEGHKKADCPKSAAPEPPKLDIIDPSDLAAYENVIGQMLGNGCDMGDVRRRMIMLSGSREKKAIVEAAASVHTGHYPVPPRCDWDGADDSSAVQQPRRPFQIFNKDFTSKLEPLWGDVLLCVLLTLVHYLSIAFGVLAFVVNIISVISTIIMAIRDGTFGLKTLADLTFGQVLLLIWNAAFWIVAGPILFYFGWRLRSAFTRLVALVDQRFHLQIFLQRVEMWMPEMEDDRSVKMKTGPFLPSGVAKFRVLARLNLVTPFEVRERKGLGDRPDEDMCVDNKGFVALHLEESAKKPLPVGPLPHVHCAITHKRPQAQSLIVESCDEEEDLGSGEEAYQDEGEVDVSERDEIVLDLSITGVKESLAVQSCRSSALANVVGTDSRALRDAKPECLFTLTWLMRRLTNNENRLTFALDAIPSDAASFRVPEKSRTGITTTRWWYDKMCGFLPGHPGASTLADDLLHELQSIEPCILAGTRPRVFSIANGLIPELLNPTTLLRPGLDLKSYASHFRHVLSHIDHLLNDNHVLQDTVDVCDLIRRPRFGPTQIPHF